MSRLSRSELKSIVKECLVEILSEGLSSSPSNLQENIKKVSTTHNNRHSKQSLSALDSGRQSSKNSSASRRPSYLDSISFGSSEEKQVQQEQARPNISTNITGDPILNELLADTAMSTLQEQASAERGRGMASITKGADQAAMIVSQNNPEDLFGDENAGKWAALAFS